METGKHGQRLSQPDRKPRPLHPKPRLTPRILAAAIVVLAFGLGVFRAYVPEVWIADSLKDQVLIALQ